MSGRNRIAVIGAGAWGTALAQSQAAAGRGVSLWAREAEVVDSIRADRINHAFLPGISLSPEIAVSSDAAACLDGAACALLVVPAQFLRGVLRDMRPLLAAECPVVLCAKGFERSSGALMTEVAAAELPGHPLAVLSGPTFAAEVARGLPTAITLAAEDLPLAETLVERIGSRSLRPYASNDPTGAEIGGAVKNVIAIGCGIVAGKSLGENARAALMTRGLAEMARLAKALGGQRATLMGLSGLGDLTLTCASQQSRNFSLGYALGQDRALADILAERRAVTEGVHSVAPILARAAALGVEMPVAAAIGAILDGRLALEAVIAGLLDRPFKTEWD